MGYVANGLCVLFFVVVRTRLAGIHSSEKSNSVGLKRGRRIRGNNKKEKNTNTHKKKVILEWP